MQYITQLALDRSTRTQQRRALAIENNFTFHPVLLKSSRSVIREESPINIAIATLIADSSVMRVAGGANRDRTDDLLLAKQALSQLSYGPACALLSRLVPGFWWWVWMDSNHRPPPYQDGALTN
jgi:hypothetical protein